MATAVAGLALLAAGLWVLADDRRDVESSIVARADAVGGRPVGMRIPADGAALRVALRFGRDADEPAAYAEVVGTRCSGILSDGRRLVLVGARQSEATFAGGLKAVGRIPADGGPFTLTCRRPARTAGVREVVAFPDPGPGVSPWGLALTLLGAAGLVAGPLLMRRGP
ncbi:MAG: hypothetical protein RLN63_03835 [Miltoncostaeaceae bacterium]